MNLCDRNEIQELLRRHGFRFSKSMGQNFLIESWVPEDIAAASGADRHRPPDPAAGPAGGEGSLRGAGSSALSRIAGDHGGL